MGMMRAATLFDFAFAESQMSVPVQFWWIIIIELHITASKIEIKICTHEQHNISYYIEIWSQYKENFQAEFTLREREALELGLISRENVRVRANISIKYIILFI